MSINSVKELCRSREIFTTGNNTQRLWVFHIHIHYVKIQRLLKLISLDILILNTAWYHLEISMNFVDLVGTFVMFIIHIQNQFCWIGEGVLLSLSKRLAIQASP